MENMENTKSGLSSVFNRLKFVHVGVKMMIGAVSLGAVFGGAGYHVNRMREGDVPVAYAETSQTEKAPLTRFYSETNDVVMKVFEANDIAVRKGGSDKAFAQELQKQMDGSRPVSSYAKTVPAAAAAAKEALPRLTEARAELPPVINSLDNAWQESHNDVTHTVCVPITSCSSNGKSTSCHTTISCHQVYDYTVHTYNYDSGWGAESSKCLDGFIASHDNLDTGEKLNPVTEVSARNIDAMKMSMKKKLDGKELTRAEALEYANTWATGSNFGKLQPEISGDFGRLQSLGPAWDAAHQTARSAKYRTYSHSDAGPGEYQVSSAAQGAASRIYDNAGRIVAGMDFAARAVPDMNRKIDAFVGVALKGQPGDAGALHDGILKDAREIYQKNFDGGFDVDPFSWWQVAGFATAGIVVGATAGFVAEKIIEKQEDGKRWMSYSGRRAYAV